MSSEDFKHKILPFLFSQQASYLATQSAYVQGGTSAGTVMDDAVSCIVKEQVPANIATLRRSYLTFQTGPFQGNARLRLFVTLTSTDPDTNLFVYSSAAFNENTLTYNNAPIPAGMTPGVRPAGWLGSKAFPLTTGWYELDFNLTTTGEVNLLLVSSVFGSNAFIMHSRHNTNPPQLITGI